MDATGKINPNTQFGGTWVKIENRFLYGQGTKGIGATGGAETVTLSTAQMPSHKHGVGSIEIIGTNGSQTDGYMNFGGAFHTGKSTPYAGNANRDGYFLDFTASRNRSGETASIGSGNSHNNMPPYLVVAIWKRTA